MVAVVFNITLFIILFAIVVYLVYKAKEIDKMSDEELESFVRFILDFYDAVEEEIEKREDKKQDQNIKG